LRGKVEQKRDFLDVISEKADIPLHRLPRFASSLRQQKLWGKGVPSNCLPNLPEHFNQATQSDRFETEASNLYKEAFWMYSSPSDPEFHIYNNI
jgi:hypothetical protein